LAITDVRSRPTRPKANVCHDAVKDRCHQRKERRIRDADCLRRRAKRDFDWIQGGPICRYFAEQGLTDFIATPPELELEFALRGINWKRATKKT
jgi:hypothetical protein